MYTAKGEQQRKQSIIGRSLLKVMLLGLTINRKILGKLKASFLISTICTAKNMILSFWLQTASGLTFR